ncbi:MAG TPA: methyltransferase domain-containing protein [Verrucomicrobiae bacterium]|nr:methyltransferase domain-containing protein [Verrucomicrobiae bacterium]
MAKNSESTVRVAQSTSDTWADWLLNRRHGGDPNHEPIVRAAVHRIRDRVLDGARLSAGMVLVDVGTGDGLVAFGAFERLGPSIRAVLTDISAQLLMHAERCALSAGLRDRCAFVQTDAEHLAGVADSSADVVTTRAALAYVADKAAAVRQFHRVLKPGGRVSIGEPIYQDAAVKLAALARVLPSRTEDAVVSYARLLQRCRAAQMPSTAAEIQNNPLTNFSERDLIPFFQNSGFSEIHLELHIDVRKGPALPWDTFIDKAPSPGAPSLREVFESHLNESERRQMEAELRPLVESGQHTEREAIAYLTAEKPS